MEWKNIRIEKEGVKDRKGQRYGRHKRMERKGMKGLTGKEWMSGMGRNKKIERGRLKGWKGKEGNMEREGLKEYNGKK